MKRVLVNAQITAMISSIEFIFFTVHVVGVSVVGGTNSEMVVLFMVMYMILFMIVSPYSFLMNSSHNKNRIIEHGWTNVMKNMTTNSSIFKSAINLVVCKEKMNGDNGPEIFLIEENGRPTTSSNSENHASADRRRPSHNSLDTNPQKIKSKSNGNNRSKNQQDHQSDSKASSVLGNVNEEEINNDDCDQLNKRNTTCRNQVMYKNQDESDLPFKTFVATNLIETDSSSVKTLYL